jgi:hypothetical protein
VESDPIGLKGGLNAYLYVDARPLQKADPSGLAPWLCFRAVGNVDTGNHSYFWDDKSRTCCGRSPGKDPLKGCKEAGPPTDLCFPISGSDDDSGKLFSCCNKRARQGQYFPGVNDCQDTTDDCLKKHGFGPGPGPGRMGGCKSCWATGNNPDPPPLY